MANCRPRLEANFLLVVACVPLLTACPVPIAHTELRSGTLVGNLAFADGTPASGLEIVISTQSNDEACTNPALRARTDSAGKFRFPATPKHYKVTWLVPNLDRARPQFHFCVSVGDTLRPAYAGYGSLRNADDWDSLKCVVWHLAGSPRVSCDGSAEQGVVTGGRWADETGSGGTGFYRLFLFADPTLSKQDKKNRSKPYVYVQWVEARVADSTARFATPYRERAIMSLPFDRTNVWLIQSARLWQRDGRWMASLKGYRHGFMNDMARTDLTFELGPPGQATLVPGL
jgi:hypothetical protein